MRTYLHLFSGDGCEAPGCSSSRCDLYLTNQGRNAVRACNPAHAQAAEVSLRQKETPKR